MYYLTKLAEAAIQNLFSSLQCNEQLPQRYCVQ